LHSIGYVACRKFSIILSKLLVCCCARNLSTVMQYRYKETRALDINQSRRLYTTRSSQPYLLLCVPPDTLAPLAFNCSSISCAFVALT
jgi:hypothetical protein